MEKVPRQRIAQIQSHESRQIQLPTIQTLMNNYDFGNVYTELKTTEKKFDISVILKRTEVPPRIFKVTVDNPTLR